MIYHILRPSLSQLRVIRNRAFYSTHTYSTHTATANELAISYASQHNDLDSFLRYASRTGLDPESKVFRGTHYEYVTQATLQRLSISTQRTGAANDRGIDLLGTWHLPTLTREVKVFVQCKILGSGRAGPVLARELEGAFKGLPSKYANDPGVIGMLVTTSQSTKSMRDALQRSDLPMIHLACGTDGSLSQMSWNRTAENHGLAGVTVGQTYKPDGKNEIRVIWKGQNLLT